MVINEDSVRINGSNITLTLSWGEPLSYFGPIVSYTVSWSDGTLLQNFTTTDSTTRNYTIISLTPMTNYTFSVVATNSFGSGEAGLLVDNTQGKGIDKRVVNFILNKNSLAVKRVRPGKVQSKVNNKD